MDTATGNASRNWNSRILLATARCRACSARSAIHTANATKPAVNTASTATARTVRDTIDWSRSATAAHTSTVPPVNTAIDTSSPQPYAADNPAACPNNDNIAIAAINDPAAANTATRQPGHGHHGATANTPTPASTKQTAVFTPIRPPLSAAPPRYPVTNTSSKPRPRPSAWPAITSTPNPTSSPAATTTHLRQPRDSTTSAAPVTANATAADTTIGLSRPGHRSAAVPRAAHPATTMTPTTAHTSPAIIATNPAAR